MERTAAKEGGVFGNGMETSRGTVLSSGIPLLLSSLWIVPCMWVGEEQAEGLRRSAGCLVFGGGGIGNVQRFLKQESPPRTSHSPLTPGCSGCSTRHFT